MCLVRLYFLENISPHLLQICVVLTFLSLTCDCSLISSSNSNPEISSSQTSLSTNDNTSCS